MLSPSIRDNALDWLTRAWLRQFWICIGTRVATGKDEEQELAFQAPGGEGMNTFGQ